MNKIFKDIAVSTLVFLMRGHVKRTMQLARMDIARRLLLGAEQLRVGTMYLLLGLIAASIMGAGAAMFVVGLCTMAAMHMMDPKLSEILFWIPLGFCTGGIICFAPPFLYIFLKLLSEKTWMEAVKRNKLVGKFVSDVLAEAEIRASGG